ncbi:MAG: TRAM domain-containing protein, partial [Candidatus Omnitrophica bacterium]|nr:TRAM domain-containing protein [Candidatus Omnitrophota bacterium]
MQNILTLEYARGTVFQGIAPVQSPNPIPIPIPQSLVLLHDPTLSIMSVEIQETSREFPVNLGQQLTVEIQRLNSQAEGTARPEGLATFIPGLLPEETAQIEIEKIAKTFARGKALQIDRRSSHREQPRCPVHLNPDESGTFDSNLHCGGCQLQIYQREKELEHKQEFVRDNLSRVGGLKVDVKPLVHGHPWGYRNKMSFSLALEQGEVRWGLRALEENEASVAIPSCDIARPELWKSAQTILNALVEEFGSDLMWNGEKGYLRGATVRVHTGRTNLPHQEMDRASLDPCSVVILAVASQDMPLALRAKAALASVPDLKTFLSYSDPRATNVYYDRTRFLNCLPNREPFWGEAVISEELSSWHTTGPWATLVGPMNFLQVNDEMAEKLYSKVLSLD